MLRLFSKWLCLMLLFSGDISLGRGSSSQGSSRSSSSSSFAARGSRGGGARSGGSSFRGAPSSPRPAQAGSSRAGKSGGSWGTGTYQREGSGLGPRSLSTPYRQQPANTPTTRSMATSPNYSQQQRWSTYRDAHPQPSYNFTRPMPRWGSWGWGYGSVGMWDLFFLSTVTHMFWYHHWHNADIQRALYQERIMNAKELGELEGRVKALEAQGVARNPNYLPDDAPKDIAYSKEYQESTAGSAAPPGFSPGDAVASPSHAAANSENARLPAPVSSAQEESSGLGYLGLFGLALAAYFVFVRKS